MSSGRARRHMQATVTGAICLVLSGVGIGWLIGLSMSPVLQIVVSALLTAVAGAISVLSGLGATGPDVTKDGDEAARGELATGSVPSPPAARLHQRLEGRSVTAVPLACLIGGIVLGSSFGVYGRTHDWLGADPQTLITKWRLTKLPDEQIAKRLFDQLYPPVTLPGSKGKGGEQGEQSDKKTEAPPVPQAAARLAGGLLGSESPEECKMFRSTPDKDLQRMIGTSKNAHVRQFASRCSDVKCLRAAVEELLCPEQP